MTTQTTEKPKQLDHKPAERCPYYDDGCKTVRDPLTCWSGLNTDDPFPGICPFVFGHDS